MTVTGKMTTVTITPSEPPPPTATVTAAENNNNNKGSGALSTSGKVAGLAVGVAIIVLGLIGGIAFFLWRRHKGKGAARNQALHGGDDATPRIRSRSMSESGLLGEGGRTLPRIQTGMSTRRLGSGNTNSPEETYSSHRLSSPRIVDQRLDPVSIWTQHDNSSRASVKSLQDNQDYSRRMLKVSNPDE
ncbi:MAG: hypothetical protein M1836_005714 [Candelina mexicana]|nr:MAG: hypothetical protein M1836_005714 [Candelina mexicana]